MCTHRVHTAQQWLIIHQSTVNINKIEIAHLYSVAYILKIYVGGIFEYTSFGMWWRKQKLGICEASDAYRIESIPLKCEYKEKHTRTHKTWQSVSVKGFNGMHAME